jgi:SAM-dependent methyltransferase
VRKANCQHGVIAHESRPMAELEDDSGHGSPQPFLIERDTVAGFDHRRVAPAALRNETAIVRVLADILERAGLRQGHHRALELASGTGQHCATFARVFPGIEWTPSDRDEVALESIAAWRLHAGLTNLKRAESVDLGAPDWHGAFTPDWGLILAVNLLHISPWETTEAVMTGAARLLAPTGRLVVYGCFKRDGDWVSESNREFDQTLRNEDARWGVRDTADVTAAAAKANLHLHDIIPMPANNTVMVFAPA